MIPMTIFQIIFKMTIERASRIWVSIFNWWPDTFGDVFADSPILTKLLKQWKIGFCWDSRQAEWWKFELQCKVSLQVMKLLQSWDFLCTKSEINRHTDIDTIKEKRMTNREPQNWQNRQKIPNFSKTPGLSPLPRWTRFHLCCLSFLPQRRLLQILLQRLLRLPLSLLHLLPLWDCCGDKILLFHWPTVLWISWSKNQRSPFLPPTCQLTTTRKRQKRPVDIEKEKKSAITNWFEWKSARSTAHFKPRVLK